MKNKTKISTIIGAVVIAIVVWYVLVNFPANAPTNQNNTAEPDPSSDETDPNWKKYTSDKYKFFIEYPVNFSLNEDHTYANLGPGKDIAGVAFVVSEDLTKGTNLSTDSYFSVEQLRDVSECQGTNFLSNSTSENTVTENELTYSVAMATDAAAGNRYEETVFATKLNNICYGLRLFIHSTVLENYEPGTVTEYNRQELISLYNRFRSSFITTNESKEQE